MQWRSPIGGADGVGGGQIETHRAVRGGRGIEGYGVRGGARRGQSGPAIIVVRNAHRLVTCPARGRDGLVIDDAYRAIR